MDMPLHKNIAGIFGYDINGRLCIYATGFFISKNLLLTAAHNFNLRG
jgi:hypothetical protein